MEEPRVTHVCSMCVKAFCSSKALKSHRRVVHCERSVMRYYAHTDGICPVCRACFNTRLRLLAHLDDSRRTRCHDIILADDACTYARLSDSLVDTLDEIDGEARKAARKQGHTHPIASGSATTADGKKIGHVQH